jgi:hypothetical protein
MDTTSHNRIWTNSALETNKLQLQNSFSIGRVEEPLNRTTLIASLEISSGGRTEQKSSFSGYG